MLADYESATMGSSSHAVDTFSPSDLTPEQQKMLIDIRRRKTELLLEIQVTCSELVRKVTPKLLNQVSFEKNELNDVVDGVIMARHLWIEMEMVLIIFEYELTNFAEETVSILQGCSDDEALKMSITKSKPYFSQCERLASIFRTMVHFNSSKMINSRLTRKMNSKLWCAKILWEYLCRFKKLAMSLSLDERNGQPYHSDIITVFRGMFRFTFGSNIDRFKINFKSDEKLFLSDTSYGLRLLEDNLDIGGYLERVKKIIDIKKILIPKHIPQEYYDCCVSAWILYYLPFINKKIQDSDSNELQDTSLLISLLKMIQVEKLLKFELKDRSNPFKNGLLSALNELTSLCLKKRLRDALHQVSQMIIQIPFAINPWLDLIEKHIVSEGPVKIRDEHFERLMELLKIYSDMFGKDVVLLTARDRAFTIFINRLPSWNISSSKKPVPSEDLYSFLFAEYCHTLLTSTNLSSDAIREKLDRMFLLNYIDFKGSFVKYLTACLSRRLFFISNASMKLEMYVIQKLRKIGAQSVLVNWMNQVLNGIKTSHDLNANFMSTDPKRRSHKFIICNWSTWASALDEFNINLPPDLKDYVADVEHFYENEYTGRKLEWDYFRCVGIIEFTNLVGRFDLGVTTLQLAILFAWNERRNDRITFKQLLKVTSLPDRTLRSTLWSLVACLYLTVQIMLYEPSVSDETMFVDDTEFRLNQEFCIIKDGMCQKNGMVSLVNES